MSAANPTDPTDRLMAAIRRIVRQEIRAPQLDYSCRFEYQVTSSGNGTVDALPVDSNRGLPPVQGIPIRTGLPGVSVQLAPGAHVGIGFYDANPTKPYVADYDATGAMNITINSSTGTVEHLTTIEAVVNVLAQLGPLTAGGAGWTEASVATAIGLVAAGTAILPTTLTAIKGALAAKSPNVTGLQPSVGCPNLQGG